MKLKHRSKFCLFFCLGALLAQARASVISQAPDPANPVERTLSAVHTAPVVIVREINVHPLRLNGIIRRSALKKTIPNRELNTEPTKFAEPEVRVLKVTPVSELSHNLKSKIGGLQSLSPLLNLFRNFAIDIDESNNAAHSFNQVPKQENNAVRASLRARANGPQKVSGYIKEIKSTTLPDGNTLVEKFEKPITSNESPNELADDFNLPLMGLFSPRQELVQSKAAQQTNKKQGKQRRHLANRSIFGPQLPFSDPLELLIGDGNGSERPANWRRVVHHRRHHHRSHRHRYIRRSRGFSPSLPDPMRLASPRPFVLRYREPDRLSAPRTPLSTLLGPNTGMRQQNPFGLSRTEGPDLAVDNILKNAFGPQVPDSPLQANDFDEENPDQGQSSGLEGLLSSILGNGAPQGLSGQGSNNNNVGDGSDFANLLKGLMSPQNGSAGDFLGNLLKPAGLSPSRNKIIVPASQQAEEPNLLDLLNLGPNDSPQADDDQNPLAQLLGGAASGEDADDSGPSNIGNLLSGLLGPASPPVQMDNENPRLKALRLRLPVVDFDAKVPLINNFYNIKGIRNAGRPLVFPPLGHRARPIISTPMEQPTQIVYHHRRHHHQRRHHQYRRYTRTTQAPQAPTREDPIAALLGSLLAGGAEDTKLAKI